jgi:hypothetical protein
MHQQMHELEFEAGAVVPPTYFPEVPRKKDTKPVYK